MLYSLKPKSIYLSVYPKQIQTKLAKVIEEIKQEHPTMDIGISSVIRRNDVKSPNDKKSFNDKISRVNNLLKNFCEQNNFDFLNNDNIHENCLNAGGLHLNPRGIHTLASNLRNYINY